MIRALKNQFKHFSCVPGERDLPRGRLTYVDGGGGSSRIMVATFMIGKNEMTLKSDSSRVLLLPDLATSIKVHFELPGGTTIKKVNRCESKQPWIKNEKNEYIIDVFDFECGDGVDAVLMVKGALNHSFVTRAWDFGRHPLTPPRSWEWWGNYETNINELVSGLEKRLKNRNARYEPVPGYCGLDLNAYGSCFGSAAIAAA